MPGAVSAPGYHSPKNDLSPIGGDRFNRADRIFPQVSMKFLPPFIVSLRQNALWIDIQVFVSRPPLWGFGVYVGLFSWGESRPRLYSVAALRLRLISVKQLTGPLFSPLRRLKAQSHELRHLYLSQYSRHQSGCHPQFRQFLSRIDKLVFTDR